MKSRLIIFLWITLALSCKLFAQEDKRGIVMELSVGYPELSILAGGQTAKYNGYSIQGNLIFPVASGLTYSLDLDVSYTLDTFENNASSQTEAEWAHFNGAGTGLRFRLSYFEVGIAYQYLRGSHVRAGSNTEIYEYNFNPLTWKLGFNIPLSGNTSMGLGYSSMEKTEVLSQGQSLSVQNNTIWFKIQIDFGVSFLNIMKVEESFTSTSSGSFFN